MDPNNPHSYGNYPPTADSNVGGRQDGYGYANQAYGTEPYNSYAAAWNHTSLQGQQTHNSYLSSPPQWNPAAQNPQTANQQFYRDWPNQAGSYHVFQPSQNQPSLDGGYRVFQQQDNFQSYLPQVFEHPIIQTQTEFSNPIPYISNETEAFNQPPAQTVSPAAVTSLNLDQYSNRDEASASTGITNAGITNARITNARTTNAGIKNAGITNAGITNARITDAGITDTASGSQLSSRPEPTVSDTDDWDPRFPKDFSWKDLPTFAGALPAAKPQGTFLVRDVVDAAKATCSHLHPSGRFPYMLLSKPLWMEEYKPPPKSKDDKDKPKRYSKRQIRDALMTLQDNLQDRRPWTKEKLRLARKLKIVGHEGFPLAQGTQVDESSDEGDENSEDDVFSESSDEDESPLPRSRPTDPVGALKYDVLSAVWAPKRTQMENEEINRRMHKLRELIQPVNSAFEKAYKESQVEQKKSKNSDAAREAKEKARKVRRRLEVIFSVVVAEGRFEVVTRCMGRERSVCAAIRLILRCRIFDDNPLDDEAVVTVLKLVLLIDSFQSSAFTALGLDEKVEKIIEQGKEMEKVKRKAEGSKEEEEKKKKAEDRPGLKVEGWITENEQIARKALRHLREMKAKTGLEEAKRGSPDPEPIKKASAKTVEAAAGAKRARSDDAVSAPPAKKLPVAAPPRAGPATGLNRATLKDGKIVNKAAVVTKPSATGTGTSREAPKAKPPLAKTPLLSGLKAASKKSSASEAPKAVDTVKNAPKTTAKADAMAASKPAAAPAKPAPKPAVAPPKPPPKPVVKPVFSFSSMMADLSKPKEIPGPAKKVTEKRPPETPEERKKRERKESRRHLRVSFETDDKLEQVRFFQQFDEEKTRGENRDVASVREEGKMHKMHKELEMDEEEEYEPPEEMSNLDWYDPAPTDLSEVASEHLRANTPRHGGFQPVDSREFQVQNDRERNTLIAVYQSTADIPQSAKSPPMITDDDFNPEVPFSEPQNTFVRKREAEERAKKNEQNSAVPDINALKGILATVERNRAVERQKVQYQAQYQAPQNPPSIYHSPAPYPNMQPQLQAPSTDQPGLAAITANLEAVFARFAEPKAAQPVAPAVDPSIQNALNIFKQQQAAQAQQYQPSVSQYQPLTSQYQAPAPAQPQPENQSGSSKLVQILESLKSWNQPQADQGQQPQVSQVAPMEPWQSQTAPQAFGNHPGNGYQPQSATQSYAASETYANDNTRKRAVDPGDVYQDAKRNKAEGKKLPANYKTVVCSFYRKGTCKKGDACTYRHE